LLPILVSEKARIGLAGQGDALGRRASLLVAAGVSPVLLTSDADEAALTGLKLVFVAGLAEEAARELTVRARAAGALVNVEDVTELCDFHVPAIVRRGDLTLTVSTGGKVPGLARRIREWLEDRVGPEWEQRVGALSAARGRWRDEGLEPSEVSKRTRDLIAQQGWLI
jgi:precorrin-2 dehydrogenase/sirohydrochlorin ferrochelatase